MEPGTQAELKAALSGWMRDDPKIDTLAYLWARWLDEREYEDFKDYEKEIAAKCVPAGVTFVKATRSPFGFQATHPILPAGCIIQFYLNGKSHGYRFKV